MKCALINFGRKSRHRGEIPDERAQLNKAIAALRRLCDALETAERVELSEIPDEDPRNSTFWANMFGDDDSQMPIAIRISHQTEADEFFDRRALKDRR